MFVSPSNNIDRFLKPSAMSLQSPFPIFDLLMELGYLGSIRKQIVFLVVDSFLGSFLRPGLGCTCIQNRNKYICY